MASCGDGSAVGYALCLVAPIHCKFFVLGHRFVMQYFWSYIPLGKRGRYFCGILNVICCCRSLPLPHGTVGWSVVCNCCISWSYSLTTVLPVKSDMTSCFVYNVIRS